jgi:actin-related protein 6
MGTAKSSRGAKAAVPPTQILPSKTLIIDNGADTMKAGYAPSSSSSETNIDPLASCLAIPNALAKTRDKRVYIGAQLTTHITDWNEATFRRPLEKGYVVNWEAEKEIWEHTFFDEKTAQKAEVRCSDPEETTLLLTEAPNAMAALQKNADEIIMEEWGFGGYLRCVGECLAILVGVDLSTVHSPRRSLGHELFASSRYGYSINTNRCRTATQRLE